MSQNDVRRSAIVLTGGPGSLLDVPDAAALVMGLEYWVGEQVERPDGSMHRAHPNAGPVIHAPELAMALARRLDVKSVELRYPPKRSDTDPRDEAGIFTRRYPTWFLAHVDPAKPRSRRLVRSREIEIDRDSHRTFFRVPHGKSTRKVAAVPVRFVQACPNGHLDEVDWDQIAHAGQLVCAGPLWLDEHGNTGDLGDTYVRCESCQARQSLGRLQGPADTGLLGPCRGQRPWLGDGEVCDDGTGKPQPNHLIVRHATNATFSLTHRAIVIPKLTSALAQAVDSVWSFIQNAPNTAMLTGMRYVPDVGSALKGFTDDEVFATIVRRREDAETGGTALSREAKAYLGAEDERGEDPGDADFTATRWPAGAGRFSPSEIERVVLVHRLREVVALWGFTRIDAPPQPLDGELSLDVVAAPLTAQSVSWLPATENRGEGIFLTLSSQAIDRWWAEPLVRERANRLAASFRTARPSDQAADDRYVATYVLLHTLSHLLLTAISLECGYSAASIRERIYLLPDCAGILLYTSSPDAEGTLGGLVETGRRLEEYLESAIRLGALCSNDPLCSGHEPGRGGDRTVHGAACHGCVLASESSCERRNELLDRALVIPTVGNPVALAFFRPRSA